MSAAEPEPLVSIDRTGGRQSEHTPTVLDELWDYVDEEVENEPVTLVVPKRPKVSVRYRTDVPPELWKAWVKKSTTRGRRAGGDGDVDWQKLAMIIVTTLCEAIIFDGTEATEDGEPLTFTSRLLQDRMGVDDAAAAVMKLYGLPVHVTGTATRIIEAAGFFDEVDEADPTTT